MAEKVDTFEDLEVFQRAYRISLEVHGTSVTFPSIEQHALGDQVERRDESLGAVLPGPGLYRRGNVAPLAGRVPGNLEDVAGFVPKMAQALKPGFF